MNGFMGIGGKNSGQQNQAIGNLNNLFNFGFSTGQKETGAGNASVGQGQSALGMAGNYFSKIASGNRQAMTQAAAPVSNAVQSQGDAARRQQSSMGTARGGGVASTNQTQKDAQMAQVDNALFGAQGGAAKEEAGVGGEQAQVGLGQLSAANSLLNNAAYASGTAGSIATQARQQSGQEQQQIIKDIFGFG